SLLPDAARRDDTRGHLAGNFAYLWYVSMTGHSPTTTRIVRNFVWRPASTSLMPSQRNSAALWTGVTQRGADMTTIEIRPDVAPMSVELREQFERDGYLVIRGALGPDEVAFYTEALDRVYASQVASGKVAPGMAMHQINAVANCPEAVGLVNHPRTF